MKMQLEGMGKLYSHSQKYQMQDHDNMNYDPETTAVYLQHGIHCHQFWMYLLNYYYVRFEVFTVVTMKYGVLWDVTPCGSCKSRCFGGTWSLFHQGNKNR
jgi:hypothetical protein